MTSNEYVLSLFSILDRTHVFQMIERRTAPTVDRISYKIASATATRAQCDPRVEAFSYL